MEIVAVLHNVRSIHNVGSIFRTADAAGVKKIYLSGITPSPTDRFGKHRPQFTKVALGAEKYVSWDASTNFPRAVLKLLQNLNGEGYKIYAVEQSKKAIPFNKLKVGSKDRIALVFGSEVRGLPSSILKAADKIIEIPMRGAVVRQAYHPRRLGGYGKESLNVSVAFGVVVYGLRY